MRSICMSLHIPSTVVVRTYAYSSCVLNCVIWLFFFLFLTVEYSHITVSCEWLISCQKSFSFSCYYIWRNDLLYVYLVQKSPQEKPLFWCYVVPWGGKDICHFFPFTLLCLPLQLINIQEDISLPQSQVADLIKELLWWYLDKLLLSCASVCGKLALLHKDKWCDSWQQFKGLFT